MFEDLSLPSPRALPQVTYEECAISDFPVCEVPQVTYEESEVSVGLGAKESFPKSLKMFLVHL